MKAKTGQSLFDIAIQCLGSASAAFELAVMNGVSLTEVPDVLEVFPAVADANIASYFAKKNIQPATAAGVIPDLIVTPVDSYISYESILQSDEVVVLEGQNFFDLATMYCGSPELAYEFAELNKMAVTDEPETGARLKKPAVDNRRIAAYYDSKKLKPATAAAQIQIPGAGGYEGIGYWAIEIDFIVS